MLQRYNMMAKLTLQEAKNRFAKFGFCTHDPAWETKCNIPNSNVEQIICKACNKIKWTYYI